MGDRDIKVHFQKYLAYKITETKLKSEQKQHRKTLNSNKKSFSTKIRELLDSEGIQAVNVEGAYVRIIKSQSQGKIAEKHVHNQETTLAANALLKALEDRLDSTEISKMVDSLADHINRNRTTSRTSITMNKKRPKGDIGTPSQQLKKICSEYCAISNELKKNSSETRKVLKNTNIDIKIHEEAITDYLKTTQTKSATLVSSGINYKVTVKDTARSKKVTRSDIVDIINSVLSRPNMNKGKFLQIVLKQILKKQSPTQTTRLAYTSN